MRTITPLKPGNGLIKTTHFTTTLSMYSRFALAKKYLHYYFTAQNGNGHGIHSPFVFSFVKNVLKDRTANLFSEKIEKRRRQLLTEEKMILVEDFGAGSTTLKFKQRRVKDIAQTSLKPKKYAALLGRIVRFYEVDTSIELGTSLGITTSYLAANSKQVISLEGSESIAAIAQQTFDELQLNNVHLVVGAFERTLPQHPLQQKKNSLLFVDGNHRCEPTLEYFRTFLSQANEDTIMVFDDIHWSKEMEAAWDVIKNTDAVTLTIDLFFIGIVWLRKDFKIKQHFVIRY